MISREDLQREWDGLTSNKEMTQQERFADLIQKNKDLEAENKKLREQNAKQKLFANVQELDNNVLEAENKERRDKIKGLEILSSVDSEDWFCEKCKEYVEGRDVTYEELHDGCGGNCT